MIFKFVVGISSVVSTAFLIRLCSVTEVILNRLPRKANGI